ncbi:hypothetical protein Q73A0000_05145 [Kaistella flava (ex Peng et al. 2021)]|uniref:Uncharacterized protein n=2 Tax=Kaistella flava (ex Peng et al. 2021) TaxID=2038776 RepID=A0A7M2Y6T6_9FLAO|nr:hypothetical protein Q73A0000_05145 [Kaistella flava (ex Peng et al. 2021)]
MISSLNEIYNSLEVLKKDYGIFCFYNNDLEKSKEVIKQYLIERFKWVNTCSFTHKNLGDTFLHSVLDSLYEYLIDEQQFKFKRDHSEFEVTVSNFVTQHSNISFINPDFSTIFGHTLVHEFYKESGCKNIIFKTIESTWNLVAEEYTEKCTIDEYMLEEENKLPLIISSMNYPSPKLTDDFVELMEGREVALYIISGVDRIADTLQLCRIIDGEFMLIKRK